MEENRRHDNQENQRSEDKDQLRGNTMNEMIRDANGDPNMDLNELRDTDQDVSNRNEGGTRNAGTSDPMQGMSWTPNDASAVRSGGTTDMDDQALGGAGMVTGRRRGSGSGLAPKTGRSGSDYDGQNKTS